MSGLRRYNIRRISRRRPENRLKKCPQMPKLQVKPPAPPGIPAGLFAKQNPPASIPNAGGSYPGAITRLLTCKLTADFADSDDVACVAVLVSVEIFHEIREFC